MEHASSASIAASLKTQSPVSLTSFCVRLGHFEVTSQSALTIKSESNTAAPHALYCDEDGQISYGHYATYLGDDVRVLVVPPLLAPTDEDSAIQCSNKACAFVMIRMARRNEILSSRNTTWHSSIESYE